MSLIMGEFSTCTQMTGLIIGCIHFFIQYPTTVSNTLRRGNGYPDRFSPQIPMFQFDHYS